MLRCPFKWTTDSWRTLVSIEDYRKLPDFARKLGSNCKSHGEPYQNYCVNHEEFICRKCIDPSHSNCKGLPAIDDFLENTRHSYAITNLSESLENILSFFRDTIKEKDTSLKTLNTKAEMIMNRIQTAKQNINKYLDKMVEDLKQELTKHVDAMKATKQTLSSQNRELQSFQNNLSILTQYASNIQLFLSSKHIQDQIQSAEENIKTLSSKGMLKGVSLDYEENDIMQKFQTPNINLASIKFKTTAAKISYKKGGSNELTLLNVTRRPIEQIRFSLHRRVRLPNDLTVTGCLQLPDKNLILAGDFYVVFMKDTGEITKKLQLRMVYDLVLIDNATLAVTDDGYITFVDINRYVKVNSVKTSSYCFGISYTNGKLTFTNDKSKLKQMDVSSKAVTDLSIPNPTYQSYLVTATDRLVYTHWEKNLVTCFNTDGSEKWNFKDESILRKSSGLTFDGDNNVIVAGLESQNLVVISADGKKSRNFSTGPAGLRNPRSVSYCKENKLLLVCAERMFAAIYAVD